MIAIVAGVAALGAMLVLVGKNDRRPHGISAVAHAAAKLPERYLEARLSGEFPHRPMTSAIPSAESEDMHRLSRHFAAVAVEIQRSGTDHHAMGVAFLLMQRYDRAIDELREAAARRPHDAAVFNDLSAAYYARATAREFPSDLMAALDAAERAWSFERTPEIAWNRALAISSFHLSDASVKAWNDVLALDDDRDWRVEAEARLAAVRSFGADRKARALDSNLGAASLGPTALTESVGDAPAEILAKFEDDVLPNWARARLRRDEEAESRYRELARRLASALIHHDSFAADAVAAIDQMCRGAHSCDQIADAHVRFADARNRIDAQRYHEAAGIFDDLRVRFASARSPFALNARFRRAVCSVHENEITAARQAGEALLSELSRHRYSALYAHTSWLLGLTTLNAGRPEESIDHYTTARTVFADLGDAKNAAQVELLLADAFEFAGDRDAAMEHRLAALKGMAATHDTSRLFLALFECGTTLASRELPFAADFFLRESIREATARERHNVAAMAWMWRSKVAAQRKEFAAAANHARLARESWYRITDPGQRALAAIDVGGSSAENERPADPAVQITETVEFFERAGNRAWLPQLLRQRALIHASHGNRYAAEADFRRAIEVIEVSLDAGSSPMLRDGLMSDARTSFEDLIGLLYDRGATREALSYAERARLVGTGPKSNEDVLAFVNGMDPTTAAVLYEVRPSSVITWLITRRSVTSFRSRKEDVAALTRLSKVAAPPDERTRAALYDILIRSWIRHAAPGTDIVIAPPPTLFGVPFAALLDRNTGRAIIDDHSVTVVPNLASLREPPVRVGPADSVLVVGDPAYAQMARLPDSRRESASVSAAYQHSMLLTGTQATARNVLARIRGTDVLHFGGHAVTNELVPQMSSLVLAAENERDSRIYVRELLERPLPMKVVVLAACSSAATHSTTPQATRTLAGAFLDGGSKAVVGTLWPVSDRSAALFSAALHDALSKGEEVVDAVRLAQIHLRKRVRNAEWTAFCVMKGNASRERS